MLVCFSLGNNPHYNSTVIGTGDSSDVAALKFPPISYSAVPHCGPILVLPELGIFHYSTLLGSRPMNTNAVYLARRSFFPAIIAFLDAGVTRIGAEKRLDIWHFLLTRSFFSAYASKETSQQG